MLELLKFLQKTRRLSYIERCSNTLHIQEYNVAEHSYYTALFAMVFADIENFLIMKDLAQELVDNPKIHDDKTEGELRERLYDTSEVIKRALIHDLEETLTGDILYPLKNENPKLKPHLDHVINTCVEDSLFVELPAGVKKYYVNLWKASKDETKEGKLVAAMDKFEILLFAISELEIGNNSFKEMYRTAKDILKKKYSNIRSLAVTINDIETEYGI